MVKRVHVSHVTGILARGKFLEELKKHAEEYDVNKELLVDIKRNERRIERDDTLEFMALDTDDGKRTVYSLYNWFFKTEPMLVENTENYNTRKLNKVHRYISSGTFKDGRKFHAVRL